MTARRGRGTPARRRRKARLKSAVIGGGVLLALLMMFWSAVWPHVTAALLLGGIGAMGWWPWRTEPDRARTGPPLATLRRDGEVKAGRRTLAEVDAMTGTQFEELVASLCRRDGCTEVRRVGGSHDNGADVLGRLPDGRTHRTP
ncbi:restriction endonuclease [Streptomyces sp. NPDC048415]|uniref:restriction endonuclease n=1 Tax=Streptomyces sp. NPDC048415 TaxID=3154822 RepID=UPI0034379A30